MRRILTSTLILLVFLPFYNCKNNEPAKPVMKEITAKDILGNPAYLAMSYGGYRHADHGIEPAIDQLKDDMKLLAAMGVKIVR
ncbi:MAG: glycosyl hydrolase family 17, partial [Aureibaculum sp.]